MAGEWLQQLPEDLRTNEALTGYATLGDFAKSHLETQGKLNDSNGKVKEFEGNVKNLTDKLANSIPKLGEKPTDEERAAYSKAFGIPEKPIDYEFPKVDGLDHDANFVEWAQKTFHSAGMSKEQGRIIGTAWNGFIAGMIEAEEKAEKEERDVAEVALKAELKDKYDAAVELTTRLIKEVATPDDLKFLDDSGLGNHPALIRLVIRFARKTGEDSTLRGIPPKPPETKMGMQYNMPKFE